MERQKRNAALRYKIKLEISDHDAAIFKIKI
jgi:hypothetical protein